MSEHVLERKFAANRGTFGTLTSDSGSAWASMEREWFHNHPRVSCIPPGRYELVRWSSKKYPRTRCLVGPGVGMVPGPGILRSAILIHPANEPWQLEGCVALGLEARSAGMLRKSRVAVLAFLAELDETDGPHWLTIKGVE